MRVRNVFAGVPCNCELCSRRVGARGRIVEAVDTETSPAWPPLLALCVPCARRIGVAAVKEK